MLENKRQVDLKLIGEIPCNCKVNLKGMQPPLVIQVKYRTKGDLRVYGSYKNQEPDASNYDIF